MQVRCRSRPQCCNGGNKQRGRKRRSAPVQSTDRHTPNKRFQHLSETDMGETSGRTGASRDYHYKRGEGYLCHAACNLFKVMVCQIWECQSNCFQGKRDRNGQEPTETTTKEICKDTVVKTHCIATDSKTCSKRISCHPIKWDTQSTLLLRRQKRSHLLYCLLWLSLCRVSFCLCAFLVVLWVLRGSFLLLLLFGVSCLVALLFFALGVWVVAVRPALSWLAPSLSTPRGWSSGAFWSS